MPHIENAIIVGAGPTGLLTALLLAQHGIRVDVFEAGPTVDQRPRGLAYGGSGTQALHRAGVVDEIRSRSWEIETLSWKKINGDVLVEMAMPDDGSPNRTLLYPVHLLSNLLLERVSQFPIATVHMSHPISDVGQVNDKAWIQVETADGLKRFEADIVVGCDGAGSIVRKSLFGRSFPGFTWDNQLVVCNLKYDMDKYECSDAQWIVDPHDWGMICGISKKDSTWRVVYGEGSNFSSEELRVRLPDKLRRLLPGSPEPAEYEVLRFSPYRVHQRCVDRMRIGRVVLVGDAAHLCNPMGGLGLTGGLADVGSLIDCLYGISDDRTGFAILDKWDEVRRGIYHSFIDPISTANFERLWNDPEVIRHTDPAFNLMRKAATDISIAKDLKLMDIAYDMTQHF